MTVDKPINQDKLSISSVSFGGDTFIQTYTSTRRMVEVSDEKDIPIGGIRLQVVDNKIEAIMLGEGSNEVRITSKSTYDNSLKILVPEKDVEVTKYKVYGKLLGLSDFSSQLYDTEEEAKEGLKMLWEEKGINSWDEERTKEFGLEVVPVKTYERPTKI